MAARPSPKVAVAFFTHVFSPGTRARLEKLRVDLRGRADVFVLAEAGAPIPETETSSAHFFDFARLRSGGARVIGEKIVPGNCHLAWLDFFRARPDYDQYWIIEYDVVFTGDWSVLFDGVEDEPADLVAAQIRAREQENAWPWWHTLDFLGDERALALASRAFFPVVRVSRKGLEELKRRVEQGWAGHFEALVPTALRAAGLTLSELGGDGPWTPENRRHLFYSAFSTGAGEMLFGTHRFVPAQFPPLLRRNALYHPVKDRLLPNAQDWSAMRQKLHLGARQLRKRNFLAYLAASLFRIAGSYRGGR